MFFLWLILGIVFMLIVYIMLIIMSKLSVEICDTKLSTEKEDGRYVNKNYKIKVSLSIGFFKICNINITKTKLEKKIIRNQANKLKKKLEEDRNNFDIETLKIIKDLQIRIEKIILKIYVGIEDAEATAILVGAVSGIVSNLVRSIENQKFLVSPIYGKNILKIDIESIITVKVIHIISIILFLQKKRRKKYVRTSNRRNYVNSYE